MNLMPKLRHSSPRRPPRRTRSKDISLQNIAGAKGSEDTPRKGSTSSRPQPLRRSKSVKQQALLAEPTEAPTRKVGRRAPNRSSSEQTNRSSIGLSIKAMANHAFFDRRKAVETPPVTRSPPPRTRSDSITDEDSNSESRDEFVLIRRNSWSMTGRGRELVSEDLCHSFSETLRPKEPSPEAVVVRKAPQKRRSFMQRIRGALPSRASSSTPAAPLLPLSPLAPSENKSGPVESSFEQELFDLPLEDPADTPPPETKGKKKKRLDPATEESMMASLPRMSMSAEDEDFVRRAYGLGDSMTFTEDAFTFSTIDTQSVVEKSVRFSKVVHKQTIKSCKKMTEEEKAEQWFNAEDRSQSRRSARCAVFRAAMETPTQVKAIDSAYNNACYLAATLSEKQLEALYKDHRDLTRHGKKLIQWNRLAEETRGLEVLISDLHNSSRAEAAADSRTMVVETSKLHKKQRNGRAGGLHELESISRQYKEMSKSAIIMARLFGEADAVVADGEAHRRLEV